MSAVIEMVGFKSGAISVLDRAGSNRRGLLWRCVCSCQKEIVASGADLRRGRVNSCGCTWRATFEATRICAKCKIEKSKEDFRPGNSGHGMSGYCRECERVYQSEQYQNNKAEWLPRMREKRIALRREVLAAYGEKCACCGETEPSFLAIDHKNNDGAEHRKEVGRGDQFYAWLRRNGYPPEFQILCANCNWGKYVNGGVCPHQVRGTNVG